jgi:hypothetical protein
VNVAARRLPGIRFEAEGPPPLAVLPRMDMAVFVGFAASGPIDVPVAVEDPGQFEALFGRDATLFWDDRAGGLTRAYLAPAVRAFFRNGGRRCFVVRVAGAGAHASSFAVPGLVARAADGTLAQPLLRARSEGSWSDDLRVASALTESPLATTAIDIASWRLDLTAVPAASVVPGDLLRVSLRTAGYVAFAAVAAVDGRTVHCDPTTALWLARRRPPEDASGTASFRNARGIEQTGELHVEADPSSPTGERVRVLLTTPAAALPAPGSLLHTRIENDELLVAVGSAKLDRASSTLGVEVVELTGEAFWPVAPPDRTFEADPVSTVEVCTFELWAEHGGMRSRLAGLGFAAGQQRYVGNLPTDAELYQGRAAAPLLDLAPELWVVASDPRFPLAGPADDAGTLYPLGMGALPQPSLGALRPEGTPLERDGLTSFDRQLFLDPRLADCGAEALLAQAEFIRLGDEPPLRGMHAALALEEATIIAVPDAVQRPWSYIPPPAAPEQSVRDPEARRPNFESCGRLQPPELSATTPDDVGTFSLQWTSSGSPSEFVVQEARDPQFGDATELYRGTQTSIDVFGRDHGVWYYRVHGMRSGEIGRWSPPLTVVITGIAGWRTADDDGYDNATLIAVQAATLQACAARGDLFALLSLPAHYREDLALAHARSLRAALADGAERALGYGAIHHPWPTTTQADDPTVFRSVPPEGTIAGVLARRTLERGAWIAPANDPLRDVIALTPPIDRSAFQGLQDAQLNILRREPHGFVVLTADTLSLEADLRSISVRRLLALLRRAAQLHGTRYVFEPNDDSLRRRVQRGFEDLLGLMFRLGAFAGATASEAFRVDVDGSSNSAQSIDAGRLIVELKIAPSLPLHFITVRLVEHAERGLRLEVA